MSCTKSRKYEKKVIYIFNKFAIFKMVKLYLSTDYIIAQEYYRFLFTSVNYFKDWNVFFKFLSVKNCLIPKNVVQDS